MRLFVENDTITVQSPAKLNLGLDILGKREDGFHELSTVMVSINLRDTILFSRAETDEISLSIESCFSSDDIIPTDSRNLIVRAADVLREFRNVASGAKISLVKRIPSQAGLGGGSSNAAATLVALNHLWKLGLTGDELHQCAAQLGSDVNFFLDSHGAALCTGRGEKIDPIRLHRPIQVVVVKPASGLSTAEVFREWSEQRKKMPPTCPLIVRAIEENSISTIPGELFNALQQPARKLNKDIDSTLRAIERSHPVSWSMTGSGSACFAVCRTYRHSQVLAESLRHLKIGDVWRVTSGV